MLDFVENVPINKVIEAGYNPRVITKESLNALQQSISRFGMVKPLIINKTNNTIIAGHQRKKAAMKLGLSHLPCIKIATPNVRDEIWLNIKHNSIETSENSVRLESFVVGGYSYCPPEKIILKRKVKNVLICSEITKLLSRYAEWGSVVTDGNGNVILNAEYAYCAKKLGYGVLCYGIPNEDVEEFLKCMSVEYGKYNFDGMGIKTYHQFLAQPGRLSTDGRVANKSVLYEDHLIPRLRKSDRIIDIGAGKMAYVKLLRSRGYDVQAYEPSLIVKGGKKLDMTGIIANIIRTEKDVKENGLFDWCVLEAVINSVADDDFEKAVLTTCNAVLKSTGILVTCTRSLESVQREYKRKDLNTGTTYPMYPIDEKNYTVSMIGSMMFKQKFHTPDSYRALLMRYFENVKLISVTTKFIYCACSEPRQLPRETYETYLEKEFNIEYPNGFKHNKHKGLVDILISKVAER